MLVLFDNSRLNAIRRAKYAAIVESKRLALVADIVTPAAHAPCECGGPPC